MLKCPPQPSPNIQILTKMGSGLFDWYRRSVQQKSAQCKRSKIEGPTGLKGELFGEFQGASARLDLNESA
ncbi:hypothetical protein Ddc_12558 [Ditylenchus destructor]|nr:hypothetical protein Ddc_12558 [Ditylenchus destructor]